jgi:hypothetical protein
VHVVVSLHTHTRAPGGFSSQLRAPLCSVISAASAGSHRTAGVASWVAFARMGGLGCAPSAPASPGETPPKEGLTTLTAARLG